MTQDLIERLRARAAESRELADYNGRNACWHLWRPIDALQAHRDARMAARYANAALDLEAAADALERTERERQNFLAMLENDRAMMAAALEADAAGGRRTQEPA